MTSDDFDRRTILNSISLFPDTLTSNNGLRTHDFGTPKLSLIEYLNNLFDFGTLCILRREEAFVQQMNSYTTRESDMKSPS